MYDKEQATELVNFSNSLFCDLGEIARKLRDHEVLERLSKGDMRQINLRLNRVFDAVYDIKGIFSKREQEAIL